MVRNVRIASQITFFVIFAVLLFVFNNKDWVQRVNTEIFLQLNPLVAFLTSIASRDVLFAVLPGAIAMTVITIFLGRVFCGFICPLGAAIDFTDKYVIGSARSVSRRPKKYVQRLKYVLLIALFVLSIFGILFPLFIDPISMITRMAAVIIDPALRLLGLTIQNGVIAIANHFTDDKKAYSVFAIVMPGSLATLLLFVIVFLGGFWDKRFWCQYICPTGAFLGLLSRFAVFRRVTIDEKCNRCSVCATRTCPTRAVKHDDIKITSSSECIVCGVCAYNHHKCNTITFLLPKAKETEGPNLLRRHFVTGILAGIITPSILKGTGIKSLSITEPIRPPGSIPEDLFLTRCIACGECIKACPNHALRPCGFFDGLLKLNTPRLSPSIGYCEPECVACTNVCPTVAIRPVPLEDKPYIKIGTAIVNTDQCLAWRGEIKCLICKKHCPYQAIGEETLVYGEITRSGPKINKDLCTGCGICEQYCAVKSNPAIRVYSHGERRVSKGPFISERKKERIRKQRECSRVG